MWYAQKAELYFELSDGLSANHWTLRVVVKSWLGSHLPSLLLVCSYRSGDKLNSIVHLRKRTEVSRESGMMCRWIIYV